MADLIVNFLQSFIKNDYLLVSLVSMFPLVELKGAIPIGTKLGLSLLQTAPLAYLGSTLICIPIFFLLIPIFNLLKKIPGVNKVVDKIEMVFKNKAVKIASKAEGDTEQAVRKVYIWSLLIFVAVPFPVTGVWTGTAIAVFLNMKFKDSILPLAIGNLIAGAIITLLTHFFAKYVDTIILVLFAIAIIMLIIFIVKVSTAKKVVPQITDTQADQNNEKVD